jgi:Mpv17 / PMP22 family
MPFSLFLVLTSCIAVVNGFAGLAELATAGAGTFHTPLLSIASLDHAHIHLASAANPAADLLQRYTHTLKEHPLTTKMLTGGFLATCGDAIAQSTNTEQDYDRRRAGSFAAFDMAYRALQHASFPIIVRQCHGQYASALLGSFGVLSAVAGHTDYLAAMEQTLASQLGIVPFIYYPVFFALTGFIQGLTSEQAVTRAFENFIPLMKRNLVFWIPVQFVQFAFVPLDLQIPFLSVCGLCWTFILSAFAGSTKGYASAPNDKEPVLVVEDDYDKEFATLAASIVLDQLDHVEQSVAAESVEGKVKELVIR